MSRWPILAYCTLNAVSHISVLIIPYSVSAGMLVCAPCHYLNHGVMYRVLRSQDFLLLWWECRHLKHPWRRPLTLTTHPSIMKQRWVCRGWQWLSRRWNNRTLNILSVLSAFFLSQWTQDSPRRLDNTINSCHKRDSEFSFLRHVGISFNIS